MEDRPKCDIHETKIVRLEKDTEEQWTHINKLEDMMRKLVPVWVTIVLTVMGALTGSALTFAGMMAKFADKIVQ